MVGVLPAQLGDVEKVLVLPEVAVVFFHSVRLQPGTWGMAGCVWCFLAPALRQKKTALMADGKTGEELPNGSAVVGPEGRKPCADAVLHGPKRYCPQGDL